MVLESTRYLLLPAVCVYLIIVILLSNKTKHNDQYRVHRTNSWLKLNLSKTVYLFTAYFDDRQNVSGHVRVITVADKRLHKHNLYCVFGFDNLDSLVVSEPLTLNTIGAGIKYHGVSFQDYVASCKCPSNHDTPTNVTLTDDEKRWHAHDFIPVMIPERPTSKLAFGTCIKTLYNKQDPYNLVEWFELHRILGTNEVTIYNQSIDEESSLIIQHYVREGFVDFRQCPNPFPVEKEPDEQISMSASLNDCYYRNLHRYEKVQITDIDEIVIPAQGLRNYTELLRAIDRERTGTHPAPYYIFRNAYFFSDIPGQTRDPKYLMTSDYKRLEVSPRRFSAKSIYDPRTCIAVFNHFCSTGIPEQIYSDWQIWVDPKFGKSQHYKKCHFDAFWKKPGSCKVMFNQTFVDKATFQFQVELRKRVYEKLAFLKLLFKKGT